MKKINLVLITSSLIISSCGFPEAVNYNVTHAMGKRAPQYAPAIVGKRKIGNPYKVMGKWYYPLQSSEGYKKYGVASWYGRDFHGKKTANGETYNMYEYTAAHKTLPLPTFARVTNVENGRSIVVKINDRGPFVKDRIIDMSYAGAKALGMHKKGTTNVIVEAISTRGGSKGYTAPPPRPKNTANRTYMPTNKIKQTPFTVRIANRSKKNGSLNRQPIQGTTPYPSLANDKYYIQFGSFADVNNARKLFYRIKDLNGVKIKPIAIDNKTYYRVVLDDITNLKQAESKLQYLQMKGFNNVILRKQ